MTIKDLTQILNSTDVKVVEINGNHQFQEKLEAMGLRIGVRITKLSTQVMHGPVTVKVGNTKIAIGHGMAKKIMVSGN
ncbi:MAG: ferrous iron transport protein A [Calditrichales bacterium]|nr:MAG: ferrous iron transport protein A [Calditrichales bacterium]